MSSNDKCKYGLIFILYHSGKLQCFCEKFMLMSTNINKCENNLFIYLFIIQSRCFVFGILNVGRYAASDYDY